MTARAKASKSQSNWMTKQRALRSGEPQFQAAGTKVDLVMIGGVIFKLNESFLVKRTIETWNNDMEWIDYIGSEDRDLYSQTLRWSDMQADLFDTDPLQGL